MNAKIAKILIAVLILAAVLTGCGAMSNAGASTVSKVADKIAGYTTPEGYTEEFGVDLLGYQMISLKGKTPNCHLFLVQAPKDADVDIETLQKQAREMQGEPKEDKVTGITIVETRTVTVKGTEVPMAVGEGVNSDNKPYREVTLLFDGRGGPALLSIASPVDEWDWNQVNDFIVSIQ